MISKPLSHVPALARRLVLWWLREMAGMLPGSMIRRGGRERAVIAMSETGAILTREGAGSGAMLGKAADPSEMAPLLARAGGLPLVLRLPSGRALRRRVTLPLAAESAMRQALTFEMDRLTPWPADKVLFDYRLAARDTVRGRLDIDLLVARLDDIRLALEIAREWGISPDRVDAEGQPDFDLMPPGIKRRRDLALRLAIGFAVIAILVAAAGLGMGIERRQAVARLLQHELSGLMERAETARALRSEIEALDRDAAFLAERKRSTLPIVAVLDHLSQVLPDDSWLAQIDIKGGEIEINGWSHSASVVVRRMEQAAPFARAEFRSPLVQDPRVGLERFHIAARLVPQ